MPKQSKKELGEDFTITFTNKLSQEFDSRRNFIFMSDDELELFKYEIILVCMQLIVKCKKSGEMDKLFDNIFGLPFSVREIKKRIKDLKNGSKP